MGIRQWWRRRIVARRPIDEALWRRVVPSMPQLAGLSPTEMERIRETATLFLRDKVFHGVEGPVDDDTRLAVAAQVGLLVLGRDYGLLRGWTTIVMYEGGFSARHQVIDEAGVVHTEESALSGEAWQGGPLVLSREDVHESVAAMDGYNLVIHELAHKLDMLNGDANGYPPLPAGMRSREWADRFSEAYADLERREASGRPMPLDPYALESPAEFFAVGSEAFFECPSVLERAYPAVYGLLCGYYGQDPLRRLGGGLSK